tara:strand:- start:32 stop:889 length:858 start_codon:yes stop_codon:yes gene_type:complete
MSLQKPIIIIGAPRSGTSILARILSRHESLAYENEPRMIWRYGNDACSDMLRVKHARPEVIRYIRKKFESRVLKKGKSRLLEKTPSNSLRVDFVNEVFPDCKFVHIIRNGYDSVLSIRSFWDSHVSGVLQKKIDQKDSILLQRLKEMHPSQIPYYAAEFASRILPSNRHARWGPRLPGMNQWIDDVDLLELCSLQWRFCVEHASIQGRKYGNRYMECRLEGLSVESVREIIKFCELPYNRAVEEYLSKEFVIGQSEKRKSTYGGEILEELYDYIGPTMRWLGYEE